MWFVCHALHSHGACFMIKRCSKTKNLFRDHPQDLRVCTPPARHPRTSTRCDRHGGSGPGRAAELMVTPKAACMLPGPRIDAFSRSQTAQRGTKPHLVASACHQVWPGSDLGLRGQMIAESHSSIRGAEFIVVYCSSLGIHRLPLELWLDQFNAHSAQCMHAYKLSPYVHGSEPPRVR